MPLKAYTRIISRWWWLILIVAGLTVGAAAYSVSQQPSIYSSSATFVVKPRTVVPDELVRAIDTLSRRVEINSTYADISESRLIRNQAIAALGIPEDQRFELSISSRVVPGTNLLEITGHATQPELAQQLTATVSIETSAYIASLGDVFTLEPLDPPPLPGEPTSPRLEIALALGSLVGLGLGLLTAAGADTVWPPGEPAESRFDPQDNLVDPEVGGYGPRHFSQLVGQAIGRARSNPDRGFTLAVYGPSENGTAAAIEDLRTAAANLNGTLRAEDVVGHLGDGRFWILLPHTELSDPSHHIESYRRTLEEAVGGADETAGPILVGTVSMPDGYVEKYGWVGEDELMSIAIQELTVMRRQRAARIQGPTVTP